MNDMSSNQYSSKKITFSLGKLLSMSIISVVLSLSMFLTIFTPYPIGLASILYGRSKGLSVAVVASLICCAYSVYTTGNLAFVFVFLSLAFSGVGISEIVIRGINPMKGILGILGVFVMIASIGGYLYVSEKGDTVRNILIAEVKTQSVLLEQLRTNVKESEEKSSIEAEALLSDPEKIVDNIIINGPSYFLMSILVFLWVNMFLVLKSQHMITSKDKKMKYTEKYLSEFKVHEQAIWLVILFACLALFGESLGVGYVNFAFSALKVIGVFYFFQGFGLYIALMDFLNLRGFFRSMMIVITVLTAGQALAFIGLFDMFINFRNFLKKKN